MGIPYPENAHCSKCLDCDWRSPRATLGEALIAGVAHSLDANTSGPESHMVVLVDLDARKGQVSEFDLSGVGLALKE